MHISSIYLLAEYCNWVDQTLKMEDGWPRNAKVLDNQVITHI